MGKSENERLTGHAESKTGWRQNSKAEHLPSVQGRWVLPQKPWKKSKYDQGLFSVRWLSSVGLGLLEQPGTCEWLKPKSMSAEKLWAIQLLNRWKLILNLIASNWDFRSIPGRGLGLKLGGCTGWFYANWAQARVIREEEPHLRKRLHKTGL